MATLRRLLLGPPIPSRGLEDTLLPKVLALPVFSSDALSSVAYATEEILIVLLAASAAAAHLVLPISLGVAALMVIVVASYRQTVRAYPHGGGAYVVAKQNLGTVPGLVAAAALLTDYVLTVAVSITAGVFAITSAAPGLHHLRLELSLGFVAFMALANLRGLRESGVLFAVPAYAFLISIFTMIAVGLFRCVGGCPFTPESASLPAPVAAIGLFVILHAYASGSTALTGVEAISNGVPAFRDPKARNAATTLAIMGGLSALMFLGISWLALHAGATPGTRVSVVGQIARAVLGSGFAFYVVQATTAAILVLAANTAFQDFPRLSSILARDRFMPRPFENRGDRLVFSNGIIGLGVLAAGVIFVFDASVTRIIQLYVVGVFTSFTLSQTGMVHHWWRSREPRWKHGIAVNLVGAVATSVVLVVIAATKFMHGAWVVIVLVPLIVAGFAAMRRHYETVQARLHRGAERVDDAIPGPAVLLLSRMDLAVVPRALSTLTALQPAGIHALYVGEDHPDANALRERFAGAGVRLEFPGTAFSRGEKGVAAPVEGLAEAAAERVRAIAGGGGFVTLVVAETHSSTDRSADEIAARIRANLDPDGKIAFARIPGAAMTREAGATPVPTRVVVAVLVQGAADSDVRALNYGLSLRGEETRAIYVALDPEEETDDVRAEWARRNLGFPLEVLDAPLRHLGPPLLEEARRVTANPSTMLAIVVPEIALAKRWQEPFHNHRVRFVKHLFEREPRVIVSTVPFVLDRRGEGVPDRARPRSLGRGR